MKVSKDVKKHLKRLEKKGNKKVDRIANDIFKTMKREKKRSALLVSGALFGLSAVAYYCGYSCAKKNK